MIGDPPSLAGFFQQWRHLPGEFLRDQGDLGGKTLTYRQTAELALGFAARLQNEGIVSGDRIVIWSENRGEWIAALWGAILAGVVVVPVDYRSSPSLVRRIYEIVQAKVLLAGEAAIKDAPAGFTVWPLSRLELDSPLPRGGGPEKAILPEQLAEILFTSGATGDPKGVTLTHRNILANLKPIDRGIDKYRRYLGPFSPIRFLNLLPLSHMFGQSMAAFIPPMIGGTVISVGSQSPAVVTRTVKRGRISVIVCVPQMLQLLREYVVQRIPEAAQPQNRAKWYWAWWQYRRVHRLLGWKFWAFVVGAAPLDSELEAFWRKLGFVVIQGYGLTETAPVATLNHPFETKQGTVGKPIAGVEVHIADDGEILLRGENVTPGYYGETESLALDDEGWFPTGDIGSQDAEGRLTILGRKKEMIVSPDGLNVFPQDVERALLAQPGVRDAAVVAVANRVHAVLVLDKDVPASKVVRDANEQLEAHQKIKDHSIWPQPALPRTTGTGKLKRGEIAKWAAGQAATPQASTSAWEDTVRKFAGNRDIAPGTSIEELGLSSLDRIQMLMELEARTGISISEEQFAEAKTVSDLSRLPTDTSVTQESFEFPEWNRSAFARTLRSVLLPTVILPLARIFAWIHVSGLENLRAQPGPAIFAANHQSHFDLPSILWALPPNRRYRLATAMSKEFFDPHFHPKRYSRGERFRSSLMYYLSCLLLNTFPLPQRESGARSSLRYAGELAGDGWSILLFPEGRRTDASEIASFQPGVGMLASKLRLPVIPVRLNGLDRVLHKTARFPSAGKASVAFGPALHFEGDDYADIARKIEVAVSLLPGV